MGVVGGGDADAGDTDVGDGNNGFDAYNVIMLGLMVLTRIVMELIGVACVMIAKHVSEEVLLLLKPFI
jgi:hypothetical protein